MYNHAPPGYTCPFCLVVQRQANEHVLTRPTDIVYYDDHVTAFICSHQFVANHGHTLVIPNQHYENMYDLPPQLGYNLQALAQAVARGMKTAFGCDGVYVMQANEPMGDQTVWHYHQHVIPRFRHDNLWHT